MSETGQLIVDKLAELGYAPDFFDDNGNPVLCLIRNDENCVGECCVTISYDPNSKYYSATTQFSYHGVSGYSSIRMGWIIDELLKIGQISNGMPTKGVMDHIN
jgi:hypothetical protein